MRASVFILPICAVLAACGPRADPNFGPTQMILSPAGTLPVREERIPDDRDLKGFRFTLRVGSTDNPYDALAAYFAYCRPGEGFDRKDYPIEGFFRDPATGEWAFPYSCPRAN